MYDVYQKMFTINILKFTSRYITGKIVQTPADTRNEEHAGHVLASFFFIIFCFLFI